MFVKDVMTNKIVSIDSNETIESTSKKYRDFKIGCLMVTDGDDVVGIVTERDFIERTICIGIDPKTTKIKEIMSPDIKTINSDDSIANALDALKQNKIKKLAVVSDDRIVGIITITDIAYSRSNIQKFLEKK